MYISINQESFIFNFNPSPFFRISGPNDYYLAELREYPKGEDQSLLVDSYKISAGGISSWRNNFHVPIEFYCDFEFHVHKFIEDIGLKRIFTHRYTDYGKVVLFNLVTDDKEECLLWLDRVYQYQKNHGCKIAVNTNFSDINKSIPSYYNVSGIDFYKTYNIGRFPKTSNDFKTVDPRKDGLIWYGNWKTFWSYQHPRNWANLSSQEIVDDILGL
jgi:hypothetical protein